MLLLADPNDVMTDLGFDTSMTNITAAASSALRMATASLSSAMQTDFDQRLVIDTFYVPEPSDRGRRHNFRTELRLSHGFINMLPAIVGLWALRPEGLNWPQGRSDVSTALTIDLEKGVAVDVINAYYRSWIQVTYQKGFPADPDNELLYDQSVVPGWLQESATILAKIALQSNPSLEDPAIKMDSKLLQQQLAGILHPHLRYTPAAYLPTSSTLFGATQQATALHPSCPPGSNLAYQLFYPWCDV